MRILHTIFDVMALAEPNAPTTACQHFIRQNGASVFGGVKSPEGLSGWIVQVKGTHRTWLIGIWIDPVGMCYRVSYPQELPAEAKLLKGPLL